MHIYLFVLFDFFGLARYVQTSQMLKPNVYLYLYSFWFTCKKYKNTCIGFTLSYNLNFFTFFKMHGINWWALCIHIRAEYVYNKFHCWKERNLFSVLICKTINEINKRVSIHFSCTVIFLCICKTLTTPSPDFAICFRLEFISSLF